jgi:signal transduction histidine kinase
VRQILLNLASNAVRYTKEGSITFTLAHEGAIAGVRVSDTGEGIAAEQCEHIFDRFYRVESSRSRAHGGTGLGLTIAQLLARLQDGRIDVASEPARGSTFSLWLPAAPLESR